MSENKGSIRDPQFREVLASQSLEQISFRPLAADDNWFLTTTVPPAGLNKTTTITSLTKAYCPGWPVVPVVVVTEGTGDTFSAVSSVVTGIDQFGDFCSETVAHTNVGGTWTGTAVNAYQSITSVAVTITGTADGADGVIVGFAKTYGIGRRIKASADVVCQLFFGSADAGTIDATYQTYVVAGTPNAAKELVLLVRPKFYYSE
jgi:hypothetical protein